MSARTFVYHSPSTENSLWNLEVLGAGINEILPNQAYPPAGHPQEYQFDWDRGRTLSTFQALYITHGSGEFESESIPIIKIEAPVLFLLFPNSWHRYRPRLEKGWRERWIGFDGSAPRQLRDNGVIDPKAPFYEVGHHAGILDHFRLVFEEARNEALGFRRIAATSILQILALATSLPLRQAEEGQPMRAVVRQASFLLRERVDEIVSMEALAAEMNVGYTYFRRMFKRYTGFSPKQYHSQQRFERVKRLLQETSMPIGEIAALLSFDSTFHLSEWFKKRSGASPSSWRKQRMSIAQSR